LVEERPKSYHDMSLKLRIFLGYYKRLKSPKVVIMKPNTENAHVFKYRFDKKFDG